MDSTKNRLDTSTKKMIIFDFDGTLVDIEPVFIKIFNALAGEFGYAPLLQNEISDLKNLHLKSFIWKRLGFRIFLFPTLLRRGQKEYHKLIPEVNLFPGTKEVLDTLKAHGYHLGIISSSQKETIVALLKKFNIEMDFIFHSNVLNKSKTLRKVMSEKGLSFSETLYVGDEVRDVEACQKAHLDIISVSWGLNNKEALIKAGSLAIVDTPSSLLDMILHK